MPNAFDQTSSAYLASLDAEIERLQSIRQQIADAFSSSAPAKKSVVKTPKRKGMSEEGRRKIAAAQKARWAKKKKEVKTAANTAAKKSVAAKASAKKAPAKKIAANKAVATKTTEQA